MFLADVRHNTKILDLLISSMFLIILKQCVTKNTLYSTGRIGNGTVIGTIIEHFLCFRHQEENFSCNLILTVLYALFVYSYFTA